MHLARPTAPITTPSSHHRTTFLAPATTTRYNNTKPEELPCPGGLSELGTMARLLLMQAIRPDRVTVVLAQYITETMGSDYVFQKPYDMAQTYAESSAATPMYFVLFPGVDPTPWVEGLGKTMGLTTENGKFVNISMGQGQEAPAEAMLERCAQSGGWLMLQNVHLMQSWLTRCVALRWGPTFFTR